MLVSRIELPGQLTSAVPTTEGVVAADRGALVRVYEDGSRRVAAAAEGVPFALAADADGGVVYLERAGTDRVVVRRAALSSTDPRGLARVTNVAAGGLTSLGVTAGRGGRVFVTGEGLRPVHGVLPRSVSVVGRPVDTRFSTQAGLAVTSVTAVREPGASLADAAPVRIEAIALATGRPVTLTWPASVCCCC